MTGGDMPKAPSPVEPRYAAVVITQEILRLQTPAARWIARDAIRELKNR